MALAFALIVLLFRLVAPDLFWKAAAPVFSAADSVSRSSSALFAGWNEVSELAVELERVQRENAALASENRALFERAEALGALGERGGGIPAGVVARPPQSPYDTLLVSAGSSQGVSVGMEAFGPGGVPLGLVSAVFEDFARVSLFSMPKTKSEGWVGAAKNPLTVYGNGAGSFSATAPRAAQIAVGDLVYLPGPGALPVGSVVRVDGDASSPNVALRIQPSFNLFSLTWVLLKDTGGALLPALLSATSTLP